MFRQALNILDDLPGGGSLGANEQWAREIAGELPKCETALDKAK
jgi:hypothetical protein